MMRNMNKKEDMKENVGTYHPSLEKEMQEHRENNMNKINKTFDILLDVHGVEQIRLFPLKNFDFCAQCEFLEIGIVCGYGETKKEALTYLSSEIRDIKDECGVLTDLIENELKSKEYNIEED